ncbi:MAG: hypothetical protein WCZ23_03580 [Rhodospirillaceae bacterium]
MNSGSVILAISLAALTAASLPGKLTQGAQSDRAGPMAAEQRAANRLEGAGWTTQGWLSLTADGAYRAEVYHSPACQGALLMSGVSATMDSLTMMRRTAGPGGRVVFVYRGRLTDAPPRLWSYVGSKLEVVFARVGLMEGTGDHAVVALAVTADCADAPLPWERAG